MRGKPGGEFQNCSFIISLTILKTQNKEWGYSALIIGVFSLGGNSIKVHPGLHLSCIHLHNLIYEAICTLPTIPSAFAVIKYNF